MRPAVPIEDPLSSKPPELLLKREACVALNVPNTIRVPDDLPPPDPKRWFDETLVDGLGRPLRMTEGNEVMYLIDGPQTFKEMVNAILTAKLKGHFIYLLGWWLSDDFPLVGQDITINRLFSLASSRGVQVRAMLWDQWSKGLTQNNKEVENINKLMHGAAILDDRHLKPELGGSHHQKILVVNGSDGLIGFCGGVDINPDRVEPSKGGMPMHDVHCRIRGPAAYDLLRIFVQRWDDHPNSKKLDPEKGLLTGRMLLNASPGKDRGAGRQFVQIGRTYGNGAKHGGIDQEELSPLALRSIGYSFAPHGETTARSMIFHAIKQARRFIYIEDQYLVNMEASQALQAVLPDIKHLTILIPDPSINDCPQIMYRLQQFIAPLRAVGGGKVRVFVLVPPDAPHAYVHSKMFIIDDEFAIVGSANCNRRSYTHDSEVVAGICDQAIDGACGYNFAHRLRIALWAEHLNMDTPEGHAELADGVASAVHWLKPPYGAHIAAYNENKLLYLETVLNPANLHAAWALEDPDGS